jgi:hypothetical protein
MRPTRLDRYQEENSCWDSKKREARDESCSIMQQRDKWGRRRIGMSRTWRLMIVVLMAAFLVGCQGRVFLNLDVPIVIEPAPVYRSEVWGYLSYDHRDHHIRYTIRPNTSRHYEPLRNAEVTVVATGQSVLTDRDGYFFMRGVPHGRLSLLVRHNWVGPRSGVYISTSSR